jgi:hypothetical protein
MGELTQNTNLASEYYVLSMLYRMGMNAYLTIGNKKSVDIIIEKQDKLITIDVKGLIGKTNFPVDNLAKIEENHYLVFVSFLNKIDDPNCIPEIYIVPSKDLNKKYKELNDESLIYTNPKGNRNVVQLSRLRKLKPNYLNKWDLLNR